MERCWRISHLNKKYFRFNFSAVNGFNEGVNFIGDLVLKIIPEIKFGLFHTSGFNKRILRKSWISGAYLFAEKGIFELKSEYLWATGIFGGEHDTSDTNHFHDGFYVQLVSDLSKVKGALPVFFTLRYSRWQDKNVNSAAFLPEKMDQYVFGVGYQRNKYSSLRLEYLNENRVQNL